MLNLTIITAHFNNIEELIQTINSLKAQTYKNWNLLIIDSFTPYLFEKLPESIKNDYRVEIIQQESGIYDAMNLGILQVKNPFFQILNSGTIYKSNTILESVMTKIEILNNKYGPMIHTYKTEVINETGAIKKLKFTKFTYPFNSSHEGKIYPTPKKNRILHYHKFKIAADANFDLDYSTLYKVFFHQSTLVKYPKGGYSDSPELFNEKIQCYILLLLKTIAMARLGGTIYLTNRILRDIFIKLKNKLLKD